MQQQDAPGSDFESAPLQTGYSNEDVDDALLHPCCERCREIADVNVCLFSFLLNKLSFAYDIWSYEKMIYGVIYEELAYILHRR